MSDHFTIKCKNCESVISTCRCSSPTKTVTYSVCNNCKKNMNDKLAQQELTEILFKHAEPMEDDRKPLRKVIDDKVLPTVGLVGAGAIALAKGISNSVYTERPRTIS